MVRRGHVYCVRYGGTNKPPHQLWPFSPFRLPASVPGNKRAGVRQHTLNGLDLQRARPDPRRADEKKRKNKKRKKNMPKMCTVGTHAERGAPEQRLCRAIGYVVLRYGYNGYDPTAFHGLSRLMACYKVNTRNVAPLQGERHRFALPMVCMP